MKTRSHSFYSKSSYKEMHQKYKEWQSWPIRLLLRGWIRKEWKVNFWLQKQTYWLRLGGKITQLSWCSRVWFSRRFICLFNLWQLPLMRFRKQRTKGKKWQPNNYFKVEKVHLDHEGRMQQEVKEKGGLIFKKNQNILHNFAISIQKIFDASVSSRDRKFYWCSRLTKIKIETYGFCQKKHLKSHFEKSLFQLSKQIMLNMQST